MSGLQYPSPIKFTPRGKAVVVIVSLLAVIGVITSYSNLITAFVSGLVLLMLLAYWRLVGVARGIAASRLEVKREVIGERVEDKSLRIRLEIRNPTPVPLEHVEVYDSPPPLWETKGQPRTVVFLQPYSTVMLEYEAKPVYGWHEFGPIKVNVYDPLGFFTYNMVFEVGEPIEIKPRLISRIRGAYLVPSSPRPGGGAPGRRRGVGTIFYDIREYAPGDDLRLVDWKGYARTRKLYVKQFEQEVQVNMVIVYDATPTMFSGARGETKAENTARVIRSILEYIAWRGDNYILGVITPEGRFLSTPWLRGRTGLPIALKTLASIEWPSATALGGRVEGALEGEEGSPGVYKRVAEIVRLYQRVGRKKTLLFLFTDFYESVEAAYIYAKVLERLRSMRHEVQVLMPLTHYFEVQLLKGIEASFYTLMALEKLKEYFEIVRLLRRKGIPVIATGPVKLVESVLEKLEKYRRLLS